MNQKKKVEKEKRIEKNEKSKKKDRQYYFIVALFALFFIIYIVLVEFTSQTSYASSNEVVEEQSQKVELNYNSNDLQVPDPKQLVEENSQVTRKEELSVETIDLEYLTEYQNNPDLPQGTIQVMQNGIVGEQEIITKKIYENDELVEEIQIGNKITKSALNKIVMVGTGPYRKITEANVGDQVYVTSTMLSIYLEPDEQSQKIITVYKDEEMTVLEKSGNWYRVAYTNYSGWAMKECLTTISPEEEVEIEDEQEEPSGVSTTITKNIKLNQPSGLTLNEFKKVLSGNSQDKDKIIENNAEYFYYAEKQYGVNGIFIASVAVHESNWGTSSIAKQKKNLFGYGAYDRDPAGSAYNFTDYSECIDLLGRVFAKYYVNPPGTAIYDNQKASGKYYHGATLEGVNTKYATDKNWANAVFKWMQYFYNRI